MLIQKQFNKQNSVGGQLKILDDNYNATDAGNDQSIMINQFLKNQRNDEIKIFSRKCNSIKNNSKLSRNES